mgnify:CR=1 FL=1
MKPGLVLFDQLVLKQQRLTFIFGSDVLHPLHQGDKIRLRMAKMRAHPRAKVIGLADIDHLSARIFHQVRAGAGWQMIQIHMMSGRIHLLL